MHHICNFVPLCTRIQQQQKHEIKKAQKTLKNKKKNIKTCFLNFYKKNIKKRFLHLCQRLMQIVAANHQRT